MIVWLCRRALSLFLMALTVMSGIVGIAIPIRENDLVYLFPPWAQYLWFGGLMLGGIIALVGTCIPVVLGLFIERAGLRILAGLSVSFGCWAMAYPQRALGWAGVVTVIVFGTCCAARSFFIRVDAKEQALLQMRRELSQ